MTHTYVVLSHFVPRTSYLELRTSNFVPHLTSYLVSLLPAPCSLFTVHYSLPTLPSALP